MKTFDKKKNQEKKILDKPLLENGVLFQAEKIW